MGYELDGETCILAPNVECDAWEFFRGECGKDYVKELPCVELGYAQKPGSICCAGLTSTMISTETGDGKCITPLGSYPLCMSCGDGICDRNIENSCNCPKDCVKENTSFGPVYDTCTCSWSCQKNPDTSRSECKRICPPETYENKPSCGLRTNRCVNLEEGECELDIDCREKTDNGEYQQTNCVDGKCTTCYSVCKAIGSRSEGWYDSCSGKLIKYDNCAPKNCTSCEPVFSHCGCKWSCQEHIDEPRMDCERECLDESIPEKPVCGCVDGRCIIVRTPQCSSDGDCQKLMCVCPPDTDCECPVIRCVDGVCMTCKKTCENIGTRSEGWYDSCSGKLIKYDNCGNNYPQPPRLPDIGQPFPECPPGLTPIYFPDGLRCDKPNPCSYMDCPLGGECIVAESYPIQVRCYTEKPFNPGGNTPVSYDVKTGEVVVGQKTVDVKFISSVSGNSKVMSVDSTPAKYVGDLEIRGERLYMKTSSGDKPLAILPDQALEIAGGKQSLKKVDINLKETNSKPIYTITGSKTGNFFGLIPMQYNVKILVDAVDGTYMESETPWWNALLW